MQSLRNTFQHLSFKDFLGVFLLCSMPNMTGRPGCRTMEMNGGSSASYVPRLRPLLSLVSTLLNRSGNRRAFDYQERAGDHFHCTVEP